VTRYPRYLASDDASILLEYKALPHFQMDSMSHGCLYEQNVLTSGTYGIHIGRAKKVIVWLGKPRVNTLFPADSVALCSCPYWYRVWIVQEISSAMDLEVRWKETSGAVDKCETWDVFFDRVQESAVPKTQATTLADQREGCHGDSYLLANLMEACKDSLCEEPRDKVYGFVGIAHDCQDGSLPVDYGKSLFELYEDVVQFQYRSYRSTNFKPKTIVHFSQLVQKLLGGHEHMLKDLAGRPNPLSPIQSVKHDPFKVTSVYSGKISILGPTYEEILGVPEASRRWKVALSKTRTHIEKLWKKNEGFMRLLIELNASDLEKVCPIEPQYSWKREKSMREALGERDATNKKREALTRSEWELIPMYKLGPNPLYNMPESRAASEPPVVPFQSRLFATDDGLIGLVPHNAQKGDLIFQFLDSDVVAVVSLDGEHHMRIIGRAVIANDEYISGSKFCVPRDLHKNPNNSNIERVALDFENGVDVYMDIRTLQLMTR
jgi:hypothetical protein